MGSAGGAAAAVAALALLQIEAILVRGSRVDPRVAVLKPASAAVSIGTCGPFGAEGPIIVGQACAVTAPRALAFLAYRGTISWHDSKEA